VLNELARSSDVSIEIEENKIPVDPEVRAFCGIMGLDPLYMGNEGKMVLAVEPGEADRAISLIRQSEIGKDAAKIGTAIESVKAMPPVIMRTRVGGRVRIDMLYGEGLPRIC
jgi:hydrogenase expression/formation protein HypE